MFTADEIKAAHSKVRSGADFPAYIAEIKALGVRNYEAYVADGHIDYHGDDGYSLKVVPREYVSLPVAETLNEEKFKAELLAHQQGKTDYPTFIQMCAETGIEKWIINLDKMTCTYYDKKRREVLVEKIPE